MSRPAVVVTGASGLVGRALSRAFPIVPLPRTGGALSWDPEAGSVQDDGRLCAAVVHLAGESVAGGRWNTHRRDAIMASRVKGTRTVVDWLIARARRPEVLVCASAVGFYGNRGDQLLDESAERGRGFLSDVCVAWEKEAQRAAHAGMRVVQARFGVVLSAEGGSLGQMLPAYRLGTGGPLGSGQQWLPWIHEDDAARALLHIIRTPSIRGPVNVVAPGVVRQSDFARTLGDVLKRPAVLPAPAFALRAAFGRGMAEELLLASQRATPQRMVASGFSFQHPTLRPALESLLSQ